MIEGEPSRTAFGAARHRALHQTLEGGSVFTDPLAWAILGVTPPTDPHELAGLAEERRGLRMLIAARHRIAEEVVARAVARGARQVVVLGAGLDTFAHRNPHAGVVVYEVDHPATGPWKRDRVAEAGLDAAAARYVGVDFERDDLRTRLTDAGFDPGSPSVVMWLGVVPYLTPAAVAATLRILGGFERTAVIFDYPLPDDDDTLDEAEREARAEFRGRLAAVGEPMLGTFTPEGIDALLQNAGFRARDDRALGPNGRGHVVVART